jgi:hypothetical protein
MDVSFGDVAGSVALYTYDPFLGNYSSYMNYCMCYCSALWGGIGRMCPPCFAAIANGDASRGVYNIASHGQFIYLQETG